jgi:hypothetical protein
MQNRPAIADALYTVACGDLLPEHPVTALSARVLMAGRTMLGDSPEVFAARTGADVDLVEAIEKGTRPAWDVPGPELMPIADALHPAVGDWFWTAVTCDLLLTNLLSGDDLTTGVAAAEAFSDLPLRQLARKLLRWAIRGEGPSPVPLLSVTDRVLVRHRAAQLAESRSSDAWVGEEILTIFGGGR